MADTGTMTRISARVLSAALGLPSPTDEQVEVIERSCEIVAVDIPTIELAGGSVRCMIAGVHLDPRPVVDPEPTATAEAIDEDPHTADGQDVAQALGLP